MSLLSNGLVFEHLKGRTYGTQLTTGKVQYSSPFVSEFAEEKSADTCAYWGDVHEDGNDHVRQEVLDFVCPNQQPEQLRTSLTKTVPKARHNSLTKL